MRSFSVGFVSVMLGLYLAETGLGPVKVGTVFVAVLAGSALFIMLASLFADRVGRKRYFIALTLLTVLGGTLFPLTDSFFPLLLVSGFAGFGLGGDDRGAHGALEQPILARSTPDTRRTTLFAYYHVIRGAAAALGALFSGLPAILEQAFAVDALAAYRTMFFIYAAVGLVITALFLRLSLAAEAPTGAGPRPLFSWPRRSRGIIFKLTVLGAMDSSGSGLMLQTFMAYWFNLRFDLSLESLAGVFFGVQVLSSLSAFVAAWLARRIGLLNTMVFTHIPANLLAIGMALAPFAWLAVGMMLMRGFLSQMDVPTRNSYTMAVVDPEEQTVAAGLSQLGMQGGQLASPYVAGQLVAASLPGAPLIIGGAVKVVYDLLLWQQFRNVRPPEEQARQTKDAPAERTDTKE
jgi:MFS family permease